MSTNEHSKEEAGAEACDFTPPPGVCLGLPETPTIVGDEDNSLYNPEAWKNQSTNG